MKIFGMMRIHNESRWIGRVLQAMSPACDEIHILNDWSTDNTAEICCQFPKVTLYDSPFPKGDKNESRDKNWLYSNIIERATVCETDGDYILAIDGDEELEPSGPAKIRALVDSRQSWVYSLRVLYLWDHPERVRVDRVYENFQRPSLFKIFNPAFKFMSTPWGENEEGKSVNLHCSSVPQELQSSSIHTDVNLIHWGYIDRDRRMRKFKWYSKVDPGNEGEGFYLHMIAGDTDAFPAHIPLKHGGPPEFVPLSAIIS